MRIIKIGGGKDINIAGIIRDLAELDAELRVPTIIVHGANAVRDQLAKDLHREKRVIVSVSGYSSVFSDENALELIMMAYAGLQNKKIVQLCQQQGINAIGLSGIDGRAIQGERNKGIRVREGSKIKLLRDLSGKARNVNRELLELLIHNGYTPVLCIPVIDENNIAINSENDDIVTVLHCTFQATTIFQLIEEAGFLGEVHDSGSVIPQISPSELFLHEERAEGRMKRKLHALRTLFEYGKTEVIISDGRVEHPLKDALAGKGTVINEVKTSQ